MFFISTTKTEVMGRWVDGLPMVCSFLPADEAWFLCIVCNDC